jgi:hypothetical protein
MRDRKFIRSLFFISTITIRQISHTIGFIIGLSLVEQMRGADCDDLFR